MISSQLVLVILLILGVLWTGVWAWVLLSSRQTVPYTEIAPRVTVLRRRLFWGILVPMVVVFVASMRLLPYRSVRIGVLGPPQLSIEIMAEQWEWTFSQNEIPSGVPVEFVVTSKDVNHGFGIFDPQGRLVTQVQAMPGYRNHLIYVFSQAGTYTVRCLELCGVPHHRMFKTFTVK